MTVSDQHDAVTFKVVKKELTEELKGCGYFAEGLHGDMKQTQRDCVMKGFRSGKTEILIVTDVAQIKAEKVLEEIGRIIDEENLKDVIDIIEHQINASYYTAMDIAAAF